MVVDPSFLFIEHFLNLKNNNNNRRKNVNVRDNPFFPRAIVVFFECGLARLRCIILKASRNGNEIIAQNVNVASFSSHVVSWASCLKITKASKNVLSLIALSPQQARRSPFLLPSRQSWYLPYHMEKFKNKSRKENIWYIAQPKWWKGVAEF